MKVNLRLLRIEQPGMIPWHYSSTARLVDPHRASSSRPKDAVKTRKGLLRPENRSRQPRISFWEPAHLVSRLRVATGVPRPCFFRAGEGRSPPLAAMENVRKGPQVLYFEASPGGPTPHFSPGEERGGLALRRRVLRGNKSMGSDRSASLRPISIGSG